MNFDEFVKVVLSVHMGDDSVSRKLVEKYGKRLHFSMCFLIISGILLITSVVSNMLLVFISSLLMTCSILYISYTVEVLATKELDGLNTVKTTYKIYTLAGFILLCLSLASYIFVLV